MLDYLKRFLIVGIVALFVSLLFFAGKPQAQRLDIEAATSHWVWPADGLITDTYGTRHGQHKGLDIAALINSPIVAVDEGIVSKSYYSYSYGNVVFVKHLNQLETVYAHLSKRLVKEGQKVEQGETIGYMGDTGDSSGVHLHFEVHKKEWTVDKLNVLNPSLAFGSVNVGYEISGAAQKAGSVFTTTMSTASSANEEKHKVINQSDFSLANNKEDVNDYLVREGDTLWAIAYKYHTTVTEIQKLNRLTSDVIQPEQKLLIP